MSGTDVGRADLPCLERLCVTLPLSASGLCIRRLTRPDLDRLAAWPDFTFPYRGFEFSFRSLDAEGLDALWTARRAEPTRLSLVVDHVSQPCVAYLALLELNWEAKRIGDLAVRVHPEWCGRGIGTEALRAVLRWVFAAGVLSVDLDVAASNPRAIRCYEKVGFEPIGELWRPACDLAGADLTAARYDFVRPHVRATDSGLELRFVMMRSVRSARGS